MSAGGDAAAIRGVAEALGLALDATQVDQLAAFLTLLQRWNAVYNLTAIRDREAMLTQHLADCLAVVTPLRRHLELIDTPVPRVLDVGSGGGLPGVVLAVVCPSLEVTCVDTVAKKASFLRQAGGELGLGHRLRAVQARVEALQREEFEIITARAFASLADFAELTGSLLSPSGVWMAMKGRDPSEEISALPPDIEVFHVEPLRVPGLAAERCLVWMRPRRSSQR